MQTHRHRLPNKQRGLIPRPSLRRWIHRILRSSSAVILTLILVASLGDPRRAEATTRFIVDLGNGFSVPTQSELRNVFDKSTAFSLSAASRVENRRAWAFAEVGWEEAKGDPFVFDPTFEIDRTKLTRIPLTVGIRIDLNTRGSEAALTTQLGYGIHWVFLTWDPPLGASETKSTFGGFAELRSSYAINGTYGVWIRPRVSLLFETDFDAQPDINSSTLGVDIGLSYAFGSWSGRKHNSNNRQQ